MGRYRNYRIECDGGGEEFCEEGPSGDPDVIECCETRKEAEAQARKQGWLLNTNYDQCPECRRRG